MFRGWVQNVIRSSCGTQHAPASETMASLMIARACKTTSASAPHCRAEMSTDMPPAPCTEPNGT